MIDVQTKGLSVFEVLTNGKTWMQHMLFGISGRAGQERIPLECTIYESLL